MHICTSCYKPVLSSHDTRSDPAHNVLPTVTHFPVQASFVASHVPNPHDVRSAITTRGCKCTDNLRGDRPDVTDMGVGERGTAPVTPPLQVA